MSRHKKTPQLCMKKNLSDFIDINRETEVSETQEYQYQYRPVDKLPTMGELLSIGYKFLFFFMESY
jgi:hypothetical protein